MDVALEILDPLVLDKAYAYFAPAKHFEINATNAAHSSAAFDATSVPSPLSFGSSMPRDDIWRQVISILSITQLGACSLYWIFSALSYYFIFDRRLEHHPRFLKNQVWQEMKSSMSAVPFINILTLPFFLGEVRGHSFLYTHVDEYGWAWLGCSVVLFMVWNDFMIYWIHRLEHHPSVYKYIHKPHHKWIGKLRAFLDKASLMDDDKWTGRLTRYMQSRRLGQPWHSTLSTATFSRSHTSELSASPCAIPPGHVLT